MARKSPNRRQARQAKERRLAYTARKSVHERGERRKVRDNVLAASIGVVVLALAVTAQLLYFGAGPGSASPSPTPAATPADTATPTPAPTPTGTNTGDVPSPSIAEGRLWHGSLTIDGATLGIELDGKKAPQAVASEVHLIRSKFYTGTECHRLTTGARFKVLQCGDPLGSDPAKAGTGGPGYSYGPIENAPADGDYAKGTIAMARTGGNAYSMGSQFFIVYGDTTIPADSAGGYTVVGRVTSGLDSLISKVVDKGVQGGKADGRPVAKAVIRSAEIR